MSKNLIYIVNITDPNAKVDHTQYSKPCIASWEYYCSVHNIDFHVVTEADKRCGKPIWHKELAFEYASNYEKIGIVDADTMIRWDAPNIFDTFGEEFCMVKDDTNLNWIYKSLENYSKFFPGMDLNIDEYGNAGVLFFHTKYLNVCEEVFKLYQSNQEELDAWNKGGGREQTIFNFTLKKLGVPVKYISPKWNLISMHKRELFKHNFQLGDKTPHFIKYGYVWHFTGFAIEQRNNIVKQTWELVKNNYEN